MLLNDKKYVMYYLLLILYKNKYIILITNMLNVLMFYLHFKLGYEV